MPIFRMADLSSKLVQFILSFGFNNITDFKVRLHVYEYLEFNKWKWYHYK